MLLSDGALDLASVLLLPRDFFNPVLGRAVLRDDDLL
jgi:hypothetical protein